MNRKNRFRRPMALLLSLALCVGLVPSAFAAQQNSYHDPAEHWQEANNRTNELDSNATITHETFTCGECGKQTSFLAFRTPEYTRDSQTALSRNVKYSDGTMVDGEGQGSILDGVPGQDAYYTGYHWTKAVCETCGGINTNMAKTDYGYLKNVYWLYDCANNFFEALPDSETIEQVDSEYHRVTTTSGEYCGFCYGTYKESSSSLERHHMESSIRPELAHDRFVEMATCADCGYAETAYTAAKAVIADYFGVVDGQPHTVTVSDLSEAGVTTAIRYGHTADGCTLTSAPNYTEAGDYPVYYEITYTFQNTDMVEDGVAYVHLRDESTEETDGDGSCGEDHNWTLLDSVAPTCLTLGYDRYLCVDCGAIEKRDYEAALGHAFQSIVIRDATCETPGKVLEICERCGTVQESTTPKGEHEFSVTTVPATCTSPGYTLQECAVCGERHITDITAALPHNYVDKTTPATCEGGGKTIHICEGCGSSFVTDYTDGLFHGDEPITRAEFTAMAVRFFDTYGDGDPAIMEEYSGFWDVSPGHWAAGYIADAARYGWVVGYGDGTFHADDEITRAEVVTIVNRLLGREADQEYIADHPRGLVLFPDVSKSYWAYYDILEAANGHTASMQDAETWLKA